MINVYCDESCHLENDKINVMVLGGVWCDHNKVVEISNRIIQIKEKHGVKADSEIKWTKIGPAKKQLYLDIVDYYFDNDDINFRCLIIPDKSILDHNKFAQTHDDWYYKMYFNMLKVIFNPHEYYNIYIDIKDTNSYWKCQKLHEVCCNNLYDFSYRIIRKVQPIRSHEVQIMQIVDILTGAAAYRNRLFPSDFRKSKTKVEIVSRIIKRSGYQLNKNTLLRENKFNILMWHPGREGLHD